MTLAPTSSTTSGRRDSMGSSYSRIAEYRWARSTRISVWSTSDCNWGIESSQARTCSGEASGMNALSRSRMLRGGVP